MSKQMSRDRRAWRDLLWSVCYNEMRAPKASMVYGTSLLTRFPG